MRNTRTITMRELNDLVRSRRTYRRRRAMLREQHAFDDTDNDLATLFANGPRD